MFFIYSAIPELMIERVGLSSSMQDLQNNRQLSFKHTLCSWLFWASLIICAILTILLDIFIYVQNDGNTNIADRGRRIGGIILSVCSFSMLVFLAIVTPLVAVSTSDALIENEESMGDVIMYYIMNNDKTLEKMSSIYQNYITTSNLSSEEKTFIGTIRNKLQSLQTQLIKENIDFNQEIFSSILNDMESLDTIINSTNDFTKFNSLVENIANNMKLLGSSGSSSISNRIAQYIKNNYNALGETASIYQSDIAPSNLSDNEKNFIKTMVNNLKSIKTQLVAMNINFNGDILDSILKNLENLDIIVNSTYDFQNFSSIMGDLENNLKILGNNFNSVTQEIERFNSDYKLFFGVGSNLNNKDNMIDVVSKINQFIANFQTYINRATTADSIITDMGNISSTFIDLYRNYRSKTYTTLEDFLNDFNNVVKTNSQDFAMILSVYKQFISDGDNTTIPQNIQDLLIAMIAKFHLIGWTYSSSATVDDFIVFIKKWESDTTLKAKLMNDIFNSLNISLLQAIDQDSQLYDISLKLKNTLLNLGLQTSMDVQNTTIQIQQLLPFYQSMKDMFLSLNILDSSSNALIQAQNQFNIFNTMKTNLVNNFLSNTIDNYKNIIDGFANILSTHDLIMLTKSSNKFADFLEAIEFLNISKLIQHFQDFDSNFAGLMGYQSFFDAIKNTVNVDISRVYKGNTFSIPTFETFKTDHGVNEIDNSLDQYIIFLIDFYNKNRNFINQTNIALNNLPAVNLSSITSSLYSKISSMETTYNQNLSNNSLTLSSALTALQQLQNQYKTLLKTLTLLSVIVFSVNSKEAMVVTTNTQGKTSFGSVAPFWIEGVDSTVYSLNSIGYYPEKSSSGAEDVLMILGGQLQLSILSYISLSSWFSYPGFISTGLPTPLAAFSPYFHSEISVASGL